MGDRELLKEARRHLSEHANCGQAHAPSVLALIDRIDAALAAPVSTGEDVHGVVAGEAPIDMVLHCPKCGKQHIDRDESPSEREWAAMSAGDREPQYWTNPPHRSHLCHGCRHIWRPADVPTNGVQAVKTRGKADSPIAAAPPSDDARDALVVPPLNDDLREILGRPNFSCAGIANILRAAGNKIAEKAEAEQAATIHWLLGIYAKHGPHWRHEGEVALRKMDAAMRAQGESK